MGMTRREFVKETLTTLGFLALPGGLFAAPADWKPKGKKPNLVFGILSDSHLMVGGDGKLPHPNFPLRYVHNAMKLFKSRSIDAFVHLGDAAHRGCVREWEFHKELFDDVFGKRGAGVPEKIIIVGNHEYFGHDARIKKIWPDPKAWTENAIRADVARHYERVWGETFAAVLHKEVKGCHFFGRHWETPESALSDFVNAHAGECSLAGAKPFFLLSHARNHFKCRADLKAFPNALAFFGHWHQSNADWKSIYHSDGLFPEICCGACRHDGGNTLDANESVLKARETSSEKNYHSNKVPSRQAMVVSVYDDMVVFERHEVGLGGKLGPDWVLPLGQYKPHPFTRGELKKVIGSPEFPPKAKLVAEKATKGAIKIKIPPADGNPDSRVFAYDVVVVGDDPKARLFKSVYFEGCNVAPGHEPNHGITEVEIPVAELPAGKNLTIAVRPVSSLGTKGKTLGTTFRV